VKYEEVSMSSGNEPERIIDELLERLRLRGGKLTREDVQGTVQAIVEKGDRRYIHQTGAFFELLREFARQRRIGEIAEACALYVEVYPVTWAFVSSNVSPILVNFYFPFLEDFPYEAFIQYTAFCEDWSQPIRNTFNNPPMFRLAIARLTEAVRRFAKENL
jgi:hypothetical protein